MIYYFTLPRLAISKSSKKHGVLVFFSSNIKILIWRSKLLNLISQGQICVFNLDHPGYTEYTSPMSTETMLCLYHSAVFEPFYSKSHCWIVVRSIKPWAKSIGFLKYHILAFQKITLSKLYNSTRLQFLHLWTGRMKMPTL